MRVLAFATTLLLAACGSDDNARVRVDVSSLWQQSAQSVDTISVRIFDASDQLVDGAQLATTTDQADFEIRAGTLRFEVEALTAAAAPSFFGEKTQTVPPGEAVVDVPVAVFPAGGVQATVSVSDGTPVPAGTVALASANNPRNDPDAPNDRELPINGDAIAGTLLDGMTTLQIDFVIGSTPYSGSTTVDVVREQIASAIVVSVAP